MRKLICLAVIAAVAASVSQLGAAANKTIKDVMAEGHKGKPALCGLASQGKASKADMDKLVALYEDLGKNKPSKGDEAAWKKKCEALLAAAKKLAADPADKAAVKAYADAVNCKACHNDFK